VIKKEKEKEVPLRLDRLVRSATAGNAGEDYCAYIIDCMSEVADLSDWPIADIDAIWAEAAKSDLTVQKFAEMKMAQLMGAGK